MAEDFDAASALDAFEMQEQASPSAPVETDDPDALLQHFEKIDKGEAEMPKPAEFSFLEYVGANTQLGVSGVKRGVWGAQAMLDESKYEQAKIETDTTETRALQAGVQRYNNDWNLGMFDIRKAIGDVVGSLPQMGVSTAAAGVGAAVGAGVGAATAAVAGQLGPQAAAPEELITIPGAMGVFASRGATIGSMTATSTIMGGQLYMDLRKKGITHETARMWGAIGGLAMGAVETLQLKGLGQAGRAAMSEKLKSEAGKGVFRSFVTGYFKEAGIQASEEGEQKVAEMLSTKIALLIDNGETIDSADMVEILASAATETGSAILPSMIMVGGAKGIGLGLGESLQQFRAMSESAQRQDAIYNDKTAAIGANVVQGAIENKASVADALGLVWQGLNAKKPTTEQIDAASKMTPDEALNAAMGITEDINTPTLKAGVTENVYAAEATPQIEATPQTEAQAQTTPLTEDAKAARLARISEDKTRLDKTIAATKKELEKRDVVGLQTKLTEAEQNATAANEAVAKLSAPFEVVKTLKAEEADLENKKTVLQKEIDEYLGADYTRYGDAKHSELLAALNETQAQQLDVAKRRSTLETSILESDTKNKENFRTQLVEAQDAETLISNMRSYNTHVVRLVQQLVREYKRYIREAERHGGRIESSAKSQFNRLKAKAFEGFAKTRDALQKTMVNQVSKGGRSDGYIAQRVNALAQHLDAMEEAFKNLGAPVDGVVDIRGRAVLVDSPAFDFFEITQEDKDFLKRSEEFLASGATEPQYSEKALEQAYQVQEQTQKELALAARALRKAQEGSTATKALQNTLDKAQSQRDTLQTEEDLINEGLLTTEDIKNAKGTVTVGQLVRARLKAVDTAAVEFRKGLKKGTVDTKAQVRAVQTELTKLVKTAGLTLNDRAKFIDAIKAVQTPEQLDKALPVITERIEKLVAAQEKRDAMAALNTMLSRAELKKGGKRPKGKYTAEVQEVLDLYSNLIGDRDAQVQTVMRVQDKIVNGEMPTEKDIMAASLAEQLANLEDKPAADILAVAAELQSIIETGKAGALEAAMKRAAESAERQRAGRESIQGNRPYTEDLRREGLRETSLRFVRSFWSGKAAWDDLMQLLSQHDKKGVLADLLNSTEYIEREAAGLESATKKATDMILEATGGKNKKALFKQFGRDELSENQGKYTDAEGDVVSLEMSRSEMRKLWMEMQDPTLRESLEKGNKYTFRDSENIEAIDVSTEQLLDEALTAQDKAIAKAQLDFYKTFYEEVVNPFWREKFGTDLPSNEFYSPIQREGIDETKEEGSFLQQMVQRGGVLPGSSITRVKNINPIKRQSDISTLARHTSEWARFIAWYDFERATSDVFLAKPPKGEKSTQDIITGKYGRNVWKMIIKAREDMLVGRAGTSDVGWEWLDSLRRKTATAYVGGKPEQFLKQYTSVLAALEQVNPVELVAGIAEFHAKPLKVWNTLRESATFRNRKESYDRDFKEMFNSKKFGALAPAKGLADFMMTAVALGDQYTVLSGGWAVYKKALKQTGSKEKALLKFNEWFDTTQQSGNTARLGAAQRGGSVSRFLTLFTSQPMQMTNKIINANRKFLANPTPASFARAVKATMIFHLLVPTTFQIVASGLDGWDEDDDNQIFRTMLFGPWLQVPILGDAINGLSIVAMNGLFGDDERLWKPGFIPFQIIDNVVGVARSGMKWLEEGDTESGLKVLKHAAKASPILPSPIGGLPWPAAEKWLEYVAAPEEDEETQ